MMDIIAIIVAIIVSFAHAAPTVRTDTTAISAGSSIRIPLKNTSHELLATPPITDIHSDLDSDFDTGLKWEGEVLLGLNKTFYGDFSEIMDQIMAVNPDYHNFTASNEFHYAASNDTTIIQKRSMISGDCGTYANALAMGIIDDARHIHSLRGACTAPAHSCIRMACTRESAIYWCNRMPQQINQPCFKLADYATWIYDQCAESKFRDDAPLAGELFDSMGYSIVTAYGQCIGGSKHIDPVRFPKPGKFTGKGQYKPHICRNCMVEGEGFLDVPGDHTHD